jgi:hypothetical protein
MSRYRVSFFKNLLSSDGHQFRCLQQSVVIRRARSPDRAIEAAKRRFERCCHLADWRLHADGVELENPPIMLLLVRCLSRERGKR